MLQCLYPHIYVHLAFKSLTLLLKSLPPPLQISENTFTFSGKCILVFWNNPVDVLENQETRIKQEKQLLKHGQIVIDDKTLIAEILG